MRRPLWIALGALLFLASFWLSVMWRFPGGALAGYLASQWQTPGVAVHLAPVRLAGWALRSDALLVQAEGARSAPLLALQNLSIPVFRLPGGVALHAALGRTGQVSADWPWDGSRFNLQSANLNLEEIPALFQQHLVAVRGQVSVQAHLSGPLPVAGNPQDPLPDGTVSAQGEDIQLSQLSVAGVALPPLRLHALALRARTGRTLVVEGLTFQGDVQGSVSGTIVPDLVNPMNSRLNLHVTTTISPAWMNQLGSLRGLLETVMNGERLDAEVTGTLGAPALQPVARRP